MEQYGVQDPFESLSSKCKVCGYRAGLHYPESKDKTWCPAKPRRTLKSKLNDLLM